MSLGDAATATPDRPIAATVTQWSPAQGISDVGLTLDVLVGPKNDTRQSNVLAKHCQVNASGPDSMDLQVPCN
jgi:hypothetical protein